MKSVSKEKGHKMAWQTLNYIPKSIDKWIFNEKENAETLWKTNRKTMTPHLDGGEGVFSSQVGNISVFFILIF